LLKLNKEIKDMALNKKIIQRGKQNKLSKLGRNDSIQLSSTLNPGSEMGDKVHLPKLQLKTNVNNKLADLRDKSQSQISDYDTLKPSLLKRDTSTGLVQQTERLPLQRRNMSTIEHYSNLHQDYTNMADKKRLLPRLSRF
jgi:hypothetical protein